MPGEKAAKKSTRFQDQAGARSGGQGRTMEPPGRVTGAGKPANPNKTALCRRFGAAASAPPGMIWVYFFNISISLERRSMPSLLNTITRCFLTVLTVT